MQGRLALVSRQIHGKIILFYQDLKAGKLFLLGCEVDGCEALWSGARRRRLNRIGQGPQPCLGLGVALFVPCVPVGTDSPSSPSPCFYEWVIRTKGIGLPRVLGSFSPCLHATRFTLSSAMTSLCSRFRQNRSQSTLPTEAANNSELLGITLWSNDPEGLESAGRG